MSRASENNKKVNTDQLKSVWKMIYRLRSVVLAVPVAVCAAILAIHNQTNLPETVGLNIQANGEYAILLSRGVAVFGPLAITAVCLLMVFASKKVVYPWLVSVFSLVLPLLIYFTNFFPG